MRMDRVVLVTFLLLVFGSERENENECENENDFRRASRRASKPFVT
jgi:hypothetical protein